MNTKIGETISGEKLNSLYPVGATVSADEFDNQYNTSVAETQKKQDNILSTIVNALLSQPTLNAQLNIGGAKGIASSVVGLGELILKGTSKLPLSEKTKGTISSGINTAEELKKGLLAPKNIGEQVGKTIEQVGEFMIPVGGEIKALKILTSPLKSAAEFAGKTAVQTGGDTKEVGTSAILGAVGGAISPIVKGIQKFATRSVPEKLYSQIFKVAEDDLRASYKTIARGQELNPTLAREALERTWKGSSQNMAVYGFQKLDQLEKQVQIFVKENDLVGKKIVLDNKDGYINILQDIKDQFKKGFFPQRYLNAADLSSEVSKSTGNEISVSTALKLRRFIDNMRNTSSFKLNPNLTAKQEDFRAATDYLRKKLSDIGLKELMNEERVYIQGIDAIISDAATRLNKNILNMTDVILGGGGLATGFPGAGLGAAAAVRGFQQPVTLTNIAQALYSLRKFPQLINIFKAIPPLLNQ
jgi:hypothetical protein